MSAWSCPARVTILLAALVAAAFPLSAAVATPGDVVVSGGPYEATHADDGTARLTLTVWNLSTEELRLSLEEVTRCEAPTETHTAPASSQVEVTFTMHCEDGSEQRAASLKARPSSGSVTTVEVPFALVGPTGPAADPMLWFLGAIGVGVLAAVPPYRLWRRNPHGNPDPPPNAALPPRGLERVKRAISQGWSRVVTALKQILTRGGTPASADVGQTFRQAMELRLPGITKDWSFTDNWASNAGLATALFTGVFAATDPLEVVLGTKSSQAQSTIVVASALALALIGAAPLLLVIFKRRYKGAEGVARHHTVAGVLAASFVVVTASSGLVLTAAAALGHPWAWVAAVAASMVLLVYAWKSIPQTLALGRVTPPKEPPARWAVRLRTADGVIDGEAVEGPVPSEAGTDEAGRDAPFLQVLGHRGEISGML